MASVHPGVENTVASCFQSSSQQELWTGATRYVLAGTSAAGSRGGQQPVTPHQATTNAWWLHINPTDLFESLAFITGAWHSLQELGILFDLVDAPSFLESIHHT